MPDIMGNMKIGILGGGLTGLTLGNSLRHDFEILEKNSECGGLCRTLQEDGFTFDYGGCHILFSRDEEALEFLLNTLGRYKVRNRRNNKVYYNGNHVKYPFENGLHDLSPEDNFECLNGFIQNLIARAKGKLKPPENFAEWCTFTFGNGIADKYLIPYNRKIWKYAPEDMSAHWVTDRVPQPPAEDIIKSSLGIETEGYTHQLYYHYPQSGGIQAVIEALEADITPRTTTGFDVNSIRRDGRRWLVSDGKDTRAFNRLVATIPIFDLVAALENVPLEVREAVGQLKYNRLITILVGLSIPHLNDLTALYVPDEQVMPHRIGFPANFSSQCAPEGKSAILGEVTCSPDDNGIWNQDDRVIVDRMVEDLCKLGIISTAEEVCYSRVKRTRFAYVIYDHDYLRNTGIIRNYTDSLGITLLGRFAEFEYLNMDACVRRALTLAEELNKNDG